MDIRPYRDADLMGCLAVFASNFDLPAAAFEQFLRAPENVYFVVEHDGQIVAGGGFATAGGVEAELHWGMVRRDLQRQGLGRYLLLYRLKAIGNLDGIQFVKAVVPSPLVRFYEKSGLKPQHHGINGFTELRMKLQVCSA